MTPSKCPDCGARLPARAGRYVCGYCKRELEIVDERAAEAIPQIVIVQPGAQPRSATGGSGLLWSVGVVAVVALCVWPALRLFGRSVVSSGALPGLSALWDGKTTLECGGNDELTVEDKTVELSGTAIIAAGNCHLHLVRCQIKADVPVDAAGNARVLIEGGAIEGKSRAFEASGNATIEVRGARVVGGVKRSGNARVNGDRPERR